MRSALWLLAGLPIMLIAGAAASAGDHPVPDPAGGVTAWGKPAGGLQAGVRCPKGKQAIKPGEECPMEIVIRNVTHEPIEFQYMPDGHFWARPKDSVAEISAMYSHTGSEPRPYTVHIYPDHEMLLGSLFVGHIRPKDPPGVVVSWSSRPELAPGKYQVGTDNVLCPIKGDATDLRLGTGYLDLELIEK
jgi:hypothetical protein